MRSNFTLPLLIALLGCSLGTPSKALAYNCMPPAQTLKMDTDWNYLSPHELQSKLDQEKLHLKSSNLCLQAWKTYKKAFASLYLNPKKSCRALKKISIEPIAQIAQQRWNMSCNFQKKQTAYTQNPNFMENTTPKKGLTPEELTAYTQNPNFMKNADPEEELTPEEPANFQKKYLTALNYYIKSKNQKAIQILEEALALPISSKELIRGSLLKAKIEMNISLWNEAITSLEEVLEHENANREQKQNILWMHSFSLYMLQEYSQAADQLETLSHRYTRPADPTSRYAFWLYKARLKQNNPKQAIRAQKIIKHSNLLGFYHIYILNKENKLDTLLGKFTSGPSWDEATMGLTPDQKKRFSWLIGLGDLKLARKYLNKTLPLTKSLNRNSIIQRLQLYAFAHDFQRIAYFIARQNHSDQTYITKTIPYVLWPKVYSSQYKKQLAKYPNMNPYLPLAIAKQESAFYPQATSPAQAYGVMQMILSTAKAQAKIENYPTHKVTVQKLMQAPFSIFLGVSHLNSLFQNLNQDSIAVAASYNAGTTPYKYWKRKFHTQTDLEFMENIPYKETKKYVKLVHRNLYAYNFIYNNHNLRPRDELIQSENHTQNLLDPSNPYLNFIQKTHTPIYDYLDLIDENDN